MTDQELSTFLTQATRQQRAHWVVRIGQRLAPCIAATSTEYGPEGLEWFHATASVLDLVERWAMGQSISRFMLDLAAEVARGTANAAVGVARLLGPSAAASEAELAFAVAAYAADTARHSSTDRSVQAAQLAVRAALASAHYEEAWHITDLPALKGDSFDPLWPNDSEPAWSRAGWVQLRACTHLTPVFFC